MSHMDVHGVGGVGIAGSGSIVDIVSIPCHFHVPSCDLFDQLFVPLLSSAQEANDLMGLRVGDDKTALRAASYLAGELLRDNSFIPVRSQITSASHAYLIDLPGNNFHAETSVFAATGRRAAMFRVKVTGAIRGNKFVVGDPLTGATLFSFSRVDAEKPDFFRRDFPLLAEESRKNPAKSAGDRDNLLNGMVDLVLGVPVGNKTVTVRIQKQAETSSVEVRHHPANSAIMTAPLAALGNLSKFIAIIGEHLAGTPGSE